MKLDATFTKDERKWIARTTSDLAQDFSPKLITIVNVALLSKVDSTFYKAIHFLFIDDCLYEHTVAAYIKLWSPFVVNGGIMAFHDYNPIALFSNPTRVRDAVDAWYATSDDWDHCDSCDSIIAFKRISKHLSISLFSQAEVKWQLPIAVPA